MICINQEKFFSLVNDGCKNFQSYKIENLQIDMLINFDNFDFGNADLRGARICEATFSMCNFNGANLIDCYFQEVNFINCQIAEANFSEFSAVELDFINCNLSNVKFIDAGLGDVYFYKSNLSHSKWRGTEWCGGLIECNLSEAQMDGLSVSSVNIINTIYPNGVDGDLSWHDILVQGEPPTPEMPRNIHSLSTEMKSSIGIDYSLLKKLLSEYRWEAAVEKTAELLWKILEDDSSSIEPEWVERIPCIDLITIDSLWIESSWGQFGFSIQKDIWNSIYGEFNSNSKNSIYKIFDGNIKKYETFCQQIWSNEIDEQNLKDEQSIKLAPAGYYPNTLRIFLISTKQEKVLHHLYTRLSKCQLSIE